MPWEEGGGGVSDVHPPASVLSVTVALFIVYLAQPAILFMACALWLGIHCRANGGRSYYILLVCVRLSPCYLFIHFFIIRVVALVVFFYFFHPPGSSLTYLCVSFFFFIIIYSFLLGYMRNLHDCALSCPWAYFVLLGMMSIMCTNVLFIESHYVLIVIYPFTGIWTCYRVLRRKKNKMKCA